MKNASVKKELEKSIKDRAKAQKEADNKVRDLETNLSKSHSEVRKCISENVKLADENKTLKEILKTNNELHEKLNRKEVEKADLNKHDEPTDFTDDDEELVAFNLIQRQNRFIRSDPTEEA